MDLVHEPTVSTRRSPVEMRVGWRARFSKDGHVTEGVVSQIMVGRNFVGQEHCRVGTDDGLSLIGMLNGRDVVTVLDTSGDALARQLEAMEESA